VPSDNGTVPCEGEIYRHRLAPLDTDFLSHHAERLPAIFAPVEPRIRGTQFIRTNDQPRRSSFDMSRIRQPRIIFRDR